MTKSLYTIAIMFEISQTPITENRDGKNQRKRNENYRRKNSMKQTWQKGSALLIVGVMMISTLVALISAPVVVADTTAGSSRFDIVFDDTFMEDEVIYDVDNADNSYFLLGEGDGVQDDQATANTLGIQIQCTNDWFETGSSNATVVNVNITSYNKAVFDFTDADTSTTDIPSTPWNPGSATFLGDPTGISTSTFTWTFDVLKTTGLGAGADTAVSLRIWYNVGSGQTAVFDVQIYLSSIFDDPTTNDHEVLPYLRDVETSPGPDDSRFEAGDVFEDTALEIWNYDDEEITDVQVTLTEPTLDPNGDATDDVSLFDGRNLCILANIPAMDSDNASYRTNVDARALPGWYDGSADLTYTRSDSDLTVTEAGHVVTWEVDFSFADNDPEGDENPYSEFQLRATSVTIVDEDMMATRQVDVVAPAGDIVQSTYTDQKILVNVTIENNGNTPLYNVEFKITPDAWGATDFFRNPRFFYHETGTIDRDSITLTITTLAVGATVNFTIEMIVDADIPIGEHRLPILYNGYYFDEGELGDVTGFRQSFTNLSIIFSIVVTDSAISCHVEIDPLDINAEDKGNIRANSIAVSIFNDEEYDFIDVTVRANFNNTPWYNPIINMGDPWVWSEEANPAVPTDAWGAGDSIPATFWVDTDPSFVPDRYPFQLEITAVIEETLQQVSVVIDYTRGAVIDFSGYGPQLLVTAFTADDIVPGGYFELSLEITNLGDETARDVFVSFDADDTETEDWYLEQEFKQQFDWSGVFAEWGGATGGGVTWENSEFPSDMFYTVESLDVDNIREIVEINLYMEGVYSTPGSTIMVIKINDLAPGQNTTVDFTMIADKDMVNGKPYAIDVDINGIDPDGVTGIVSPLGTQTIEVMSSLPGESYNPVEVDWFDTGIKALTLLLFLVIVIAILLMVFSRFKGDSDDYDDDDDEFGFEDEEDDYEPLGMEDEEMPAAPMEAPAPPEEQLVEP